MELYDLISAFLKRVVIVNFMKKITQGGIPFVKQIYNKIYLKGLTDFNTVLCYFFLNLLEYFYFLCTLGLSPKSDSFIGMNYGDPGC